MKKILIIEDDVVLRENTAEFLKGKGYKVFVAKDGIIGVQQTLAHIPDLILCDISMPNMNGYEFYKTIQEIQNTSTIPLVYLSARAATEDIRAAMQLGADDYIIKPFDYLELLKVIKTRLAKHDSIERFYDEKFHALIDNPAIGVFIYQNRKFIFYNTKLASIFGYTYEEFASITLNDLINENITTKKRILNEIDRCLITKKKPISLRFLSINKENEKVNVDLYGTAISYKGVTSLVGNMIDFMDEFYSHYSRIYNEKSTLKLSPRELEVLEFICLGKTSKEISVELKLSQRTVESYRSNLLEKTECKNIAEIIMFAIRHRFIGLGEDKIL